MNAAVRPTAGASGTHSDVAVGEVEKGAASCVSRETAPVYGIPMSGGSHFQLWSVTVTEFLMSLLPMA